MCVCVCVCVLKHQALYIRKFRQLLHLNTITIRMGLAILSQSYLFMIWELALYVFFSAEVCVICILMRL